jgi:hypothetical protein
VSGGAIVVAVLVAGVAGFIASGIYYTVLSDPLAAARSDDSIPQVRPWVYGVEFVRTLIIAAVLAGVASLAGIGSWLGGIALGLALWLGFPFILWVGAIIHEGTRPTLAVIHAGDWLFKLVIIGVIVGALG